MGKALVAEGTEVLWVGFKADSEEALALKEDSLVGSIVEVVLTEPIVVASRV